jgi:hypothetical protein
MIHYYYMTVIMIITLKHLSSFFYSNASVVISSFMPSAKARLIDYSLQQRNLNLENAY